MKAFKSCVLAAAAVLIGGCIVTSVSPFYSDKDLVSDPALVGKWAKPSETNELWLFEKEESSYRLTVTTANETNQIKVHLFKLQDAMFMDWTGPDDFNAVPPPIPSHLVLRVYSIAPELRMSALNYEWLVDLLKREPKALAHEFVKPEKPGDEGRLVLTAKTPDLQAFVLRYLNDTNAWSEKIELTKTGPGESAKVKN